MILMDKEMETFDDIQSKSSLKNTQLLIKTNYFKVASWMVTATMKLKDAYSLEEKS